MYVFLTHVSAFFDFTQVHTLSMALEGIKSVTDVLSCSKCRGSFNNSHVPHRLTNSAEVDWMCAKCVNESMHHHGGVVHAEGETSHINLVQRVSTTAVNGMEELCSWLVHLSRNKFITQNQRNDLIENLTPLFLRSKQAVAAINMDDEDAMVREAVESTYKEVWWDRKGNIRKRSGLVSDSLWLKALKYKVAKKP